MWKRFRGGISWEPLEEFLKATLEHFLKESLNFFLRIPRGIFEGISGIFSKRMPGRTSERFSEGILGKMLGLIWKRTIPERTTAGIPEAVFENLSEEIYGFFPEFLAEYLQTSLKIALKEFLKEPWMFL